MGYTTNFEGRFTVSPPLDAAQVAYLKQFAETRRMKRSAVAASKLPDPLREAAFLPVGTEAGYYVAGGDHDPSVLDGNKPPVGQPGLWCQWVPTANGAFLEWDGNEKFYDYTAWLQYLVDHFLKPWGREVRGAVTWQGEETGDVGVLEARGDVVEAHEGVTQLPSQVPVPDGAREEFREANETAWLAATRGDYAATLVALEVAREHAIRRCGK